MHPGNCRTALFNYLAARKQKGVFVLRLEDTDEQRSRLEYVDAIYEDLNSLNISWDEGPDKGTDRRADKGTDKGGDYGPYSQAERKEIYANFYVQLEKQGLAYPCFCSQAALKLARKRQLAAGEPPRYPGNCRSLSPEEISDRLAAGEKPALRMKVEDDAILSFEDLVRGKQVFYGKHLGDFIIRRSDGNPAFLFANAIDDALMKIDCVLRGEDHLTNTPRQLVVLNALGLSPPTYGHISILAGDDGRPLSKRNGSRSIRSLIDDGYLPLAIVNYLARLGCSYGVDELLSLEELVSQFSLERLVQPVARYESSQLNYWQRQALTRMSPAELWSWLAVRVGDKVPDEHRELFAAIVSANILLPDEAMAWADIVFASPDFDITREDKKWFDQADFFYTAESLFCRFYGSNGWQKWIQALGEQTGKKGKELFLPLRLALTGASSGPALDGLVALMGRQEVVKRLKAAASYRF